MYFSIICQARDPSGQNLYLTDPSQGEKVTATVKSGQVLDPNQLWYVSYNPNNGGCILQNKKTHRLVQCPRGDAPARMVEDTRQNEERLEDPTCVLQIAGTSPASFNVVRGLRDQNNNMNVAGNGPYPSGIEVLFWGWNGGGDNLRWSFALESE